MKKILFIDHVNRILGGAEINLIELLGLPALHQGWTTACAIPNPSPLREGLQKHALDRGLPVQLFDYELGRGLNEMRVVGHHPLAPVMKIRAGMKAIRDGRNRLKQIMDDFQPDVVITIPNKDHIVAAPVCRSRNVLHIWWVNDILSPDFFPFIARMSFFRAARPGNSRFAAVSQLAADSLCHGGIHPSRVHAVHNGIPIEKYVPVKANSFREEFGILPSTFTFGVIGRWCSWKGQDHFMRIARKWMQLYPDSDVAFLLIGKAFNEDQGFESQLRNQAQEIHAQTGRENIRFIPFQSNLNTVLTELDCLVHASTRPEPFGRVVIEAMAAGVPVVGANGGAIPEIIDDGIDGLLAEAGSISAYLSAMKKIHDQPDLRSSLVVNATKKVQKKFSVDRVYHDFDQIISQSFKSMDV